MYGGFGAIALIGASIGNTNSQKFGNSFGRGGFTQILTGQPQGDCPYENETALPWQGGDGEAGG
ncbi:hypothetical protein BCD67_17775 [Oscillatoriales cyanobacterium USR001]|nr:hypothetical protein BCD67_17775 [Oscillatoriales cyanobacterium USR001]